MRAGLGRRSALGEGSEILFDGGGRVLGGLTIAAEGIKNMAEAAAKLREEFAAGKISAGELTEKLISAVPVVGQFWEAGRAIREAFTGEAEELARANEESKLLDESIKSQHEMMKLLRSEAKGYADHMADVAKEIASATLPLQDAKRAIDEINSGLKQASLAAQEQAEIEAHAAVSKAAITEAQKAAGEARAKSDDFSGGILAGVGGTGAASVAEGEQGEMASARAQRIANQAVRQRAEADKATRDHYADLRKQQAKADAANANKADREAHEAARAELERHNKVISDARSDAAGVAMKSLGDERAAEQSEIRKNLAGQLADVEKHYRDMQKVQGPLNIEQDAAKAAEKSALVDSARAKELAAEKEYQRQRIDADRRAAKSLADATAEASIARLKAQGDSFGAERAQLKKALSDKLADIDENARNEARALAGDTIEAQNAAKNRAEQMRKVARETAHQDEISAARQEMAKLGGTTSLVAAEVRRFDREIDRKPIIDPTTQLLAVQKQQKIAAEKAEQWLNKIYDIQHNNPAQTVSIP